MRLRVALVFFSLGVVAAGCGGGGKSGIVPPAGSNAGSGNTGPGHNENNAREHLALHPAGQQASLS